jgi:hypothetical protein
LFIHEEAIMPTKQKVVFYNEKRHTKKPGASYSSGEGKNGTQKLNKKLRN